MSTLLATTKKLNQVGSAVTTPSAITNTFTLADTSGNLERMTWENTVIAIGARAAADLANVQLAYTESGKIPSSLLNITGFEFQGDYNAGTSSPTLADSDTGKVNHIYRVTNSANPTSKDFGSGAINISDDEYIAYSGGSGSGAWINIGTGPLQAIATGGTGATTAAGARTNLELYSQAEINNRQLSKPPVNGLVFDGSTSELELAHNTVLDFGEDIDFSIEAIIYHDGNASSTRTISTTRGSGTSGHQFFISSDDRFHSYLSDGTNSLSSSASDPSGGDPLSAGWYHLVTTFDRDGNMVRYVNGVQYGSALSLSGASVGDVTNSNPLDIGNRNSGDEFEGIIASLVVYNRALSASEVAKKSADGVIDAADQWGGAGDLVVAGGFESWTSATNADNWSETLSGSSTINQESVDVDAGTYSARIDFDGSGSAAYLTPSLSSNIQPGQRYRITLRMKSSVDAKRMNLSYSTGSFNTFSSDITLTTSWATYTVEFVNTNTAAGSFRISNRFAEPSFSAYIDEVTCEPIGAFASYQGRNILPTGNVNDESSNGLHLSATSVSPMFRPTGGQFAEEFEFAHGSISSSAATTELLSLPKGCRIVGIETIVDTAFDGSTTLDVGISGTADKYANNIDVASTGRNYNASTEASESDTAATSIYVQKNQATTQGNAKFRVVYAITNPTV